MCIRDSNNHLDIFGSVEADKPIKSIIKSKEYALPDVRAITFSPSLSSPKKMGSVSELELSVRSLRRKNEEKIKFLVKCPDEEQDEIMAYNDIIDIIADQHDDELNNPERMWLFKSITANEGPLSTKHHNYNGSKYNLVVQWEDGSITREPLDIFGKDDPVSCVQLSLIHISEPTRPY